MLFKFCLRIQGFQIAKASKLLDIINPILVDIQKDTIFNWHSEKNVFYRNLENVDFSNALPIRKSDLQGVFVNYISKPYNSNNVFISSTSGSSGHPFSFAKDKFCHALTWASIEKIYGKVGLKLDSKQARFYGVPLFGKGKYVEWIKDKIMNRVRFPFFDLSNYNLDLYLGRFYRVKFEYIYGYTSALVLFARYVMENNIVLKEICPSLICCIFTSETASKEDRVLLERAFGVKVYCEYGSSETGIIAFENELGELVVDTKLLYLEEYKYPDGTKTTLVTSLFNKAFPFIRYDIGDIVTIKTTGDKTIITSLEGRTNDIIILPSGKKSAGLTFYYISRSILENSGCLKEFIIRQTKIDTFVFDIVSSRELLESEITIIENEMERYLESNLIVGINYVTSIPRLKNGKLKHFISEI